MCCLLIYIYKCVYIYILYIIQLINESFKCFVLVFYLLHILISQKDFAMV